jgi:hypothetical protein
LIPPEQDIPELLTILGYNKMRGRPKKEPDWLRNVPAEYRQEFTKKRSEIRVGGGSPSSSVRRDNPIEAASSPRQPLPSPEVFRFGPRQAVSSQPQPESVSRLALQDQHGAAACDEHGEHLCSRCKTPLDKHPGDEPAGQPGGDTGGMTSGEPGGNVDAGDRRRGHNPSTALDQFEQDLVDAQTKRKAASKADQKAKAKGILKRPASASHPKCDAGGKLILGCSKCVGAPGGCAQCRDPKFGGKRGPVQNSAMKATKVKKAVMKKVMKVAMKKG